MESPPAPRAGGLLSRHMLPALLVCVGVATLIAAHELLVSRWVAIAWVVFALVLAGVLWTAGLAARRETQHAAVLVAALRTLAENLSNVAAELGAGPRLLQDLADSARTLLGMDRAGIGVIDEEKGLLNLVAFSGDIPADAPMTFRLSDVPVIRACLQRGQVLFEEDIRTRSGEMNRSVVEQFRAAAVILVPLKVRGKVIGLLSLSDSEPRRFTETQREMAHLLASQVAVILHNHSLYEQMRSERDQRTALYQQVQRDAATRAVLLRELQHRVKNNFAAIIGLLMMSMGGLGPEARSVMQRVIDRVRAMAEAHDLFTSGLTTATLRQIVRRMLALLAAIRPPEIELHENVHDGPPMLDTPRAVALAMALFELASNAMRHRGGSPGNVWISTRRSEQSVAIDVIDDGPGIAPASAERQPGGVSGNTGGGIGLTLVRELVSRELRGTFSIGNRPEGGTIATIELPLTGEEDDQK